MWTLTDRENILDPEDFTTELDALRRAQSILWRARPYLIIGPDRRARGTAVCGTARGRDAHRQRDEPVCEECAEAHRIHEQARSIRAGRRPRVKVSAATLTELYLNAPLDVQTLLDDELGVEVCDALVDLHDRQEEVRSA